MTSRWFSRSLRGLVGLVVILLPLSSYVEQEAGTPRTQPTSDSPEALARGRAMAALESMPLYFVENRGQLDAPVAFFARGGAGSFFFTPQGVTIAMRGSTTDDGRQTTDGSPSAADRRPSVVRNWAVKVDFVGANPDAQPVGIGQTDARFSYLIGPPERWAKNLPGFTGVAYHDLSPGIDLVYRGDGNQLKYELVVQPGADPSQIRLAYRGVDVVERGEDGEP